MDRSKSQSSINKLKIQQKGEKLLRYIHANLLNSNALIYGPFGDRKVVYCDYTASGLSLRFFEDYIVNEVLPDYANIHSFLSGMACQTSAFRNDAKMIIKKSVNANDNDALLFVGSGTTGAIHKLIHNLNLTEPPIVFVGPYEHHSNLLPWRHLAYKLIRLKTDKSGIVSSEYLETALQVESKSAKSHGSKILVCLSAASNVTGILADTIKISSLVHKYGGIIFWDYAAAAPYVEIDMNPSKTYGYENSHKDAVFFSVHKFVGGPQTPGILVAKKHLFEAGEAFPHSSGGGTVSFVRRKKATYVKDVEVREEGGTPAIVESIRAGMVIQLKEAIGIDLIKRREDELTERAWNKLKDCPNIVILGDWKPKRLAIFSFIIRHTEKISREFISEKINGHGQNGDSKEKESSKSRNCLFVHHDFICALLNDLFGIQSRSGCACTGPYALDLLGINETLARSYDDALTTKDNEEIIETKTLRPGFTRINLPFFYPDTEIDFILDALVFVANYSWCFLPFYELDMKTSKWYYPTERRGDVTKHLTNINYDEGVMNWSRPNRKPNRPPPKSFKETLATANSIQQMLESILKETTGKVANDKIDRYWLKSPINYLRWFLMPSEAAADIRGLSRPTPKFPNRGSPWHPGCIERCFCPDLIKTNHTELKRICNYTHDDRAVERDRVNTIADNFDQKMNSRHKNGIMSRRKIFDLEGEMTQGMRDFIRRTETQFEKEENKYLDDFQHPPNTNKSDGKCSSTESEKRWVDPPQYMMKPFLQPKRCFYRKYRPPSQ